MDEETAKAVVASGALPKVADTLQSIVDYIAGPRRVVEQAKARGEATIIAAQAEAAIQQIRREGSAGGLSLEARRENNQRVIAYTAAKELPHNKDTDPLADDFLLRFFSDAGNVSNEQMQVLWGRLLAGEISRPNSFHPYTLGVLRNMTTLDADLFSKVCSLAWTVHNEVIPVVQREGVSESVFSGGLSFDDLQHLATIGLVSFRNDTFAAEGDARFKVSYGDRELWMVSTSGDKWVPIGEVLFTRAGLELSALNHFQAVPGQWEYVIEYWSQHGFVPDLETNP